jgi:hypothetical protein
MDDGSRDFDFLIGSWNLANRRLKKVLAGCTDWEQFPSHTTSWSMFDGAANVDELACPAKGFFGLTVRLFDSAQQQWSLYWIGSRTTIIDPPVVGRFNDGVGEFFGDDTYEGTPILCRFIWSHITPTTAHWEQAFSVDGGKVWETNWVNDLARIGPQPSRSEE